MRTPATRMRKPPEIATMTATTTSSEAEDVERRAPSAAAWTESRN